MKKLLFLICFLPLCLNGANIDYVALNTTAKNHLINLIDIDTARPNPQETQAARYIYGILNDYKIDWDIYRLEKERGNLISTLKADTSAKTINSATAAKTAKSPLIVLAHLDTAAVSDGWTHPPTKATVKDGRIYGLGSTDAKNYAAVNLTILTWLKENKIKLNRDIIFLFTADEEDGSNKGLKFLYEKHPAKLKAGFALNEGGGLIRGEEGKNNIFFVEAASKMYMDILLTAYGDSGHSSMPLQNNAIYKLSQALSTIEAYQPPFKLSPFTKNFFNKIYPLQDDDAKTTINLLNSSDRTQAMQAARVISEDAFFKTQLMDTISPTILTSGAESNTNNLEAAATLNCRLLPQTNPTTFFDNLSALFEGDEDISLTVIESPELPFPQPEPEAKDELFKAIEKTVEAVLPGTLALAGMSPASNESEILRRRGVKTYGIGPLMERNGEGPHQADENILESDFYEQLKLTLAIILNFATDEGFVIEEKADDDEEPVKNAGNIEQTSKEVVSDEKPVPEAVVSADPS
ncbi:MAG: M20/M25/M40 family metallo-hydrolase [Elusimicrobiota bacterium]|jgi:acetylornithine deacetylase/succinyl-diaminopimelate desuccinylase-like protein|nr:M20/M25/M40 family metallo-hydrolase [Elusimicrobiota bacterium]